MQPDTGTVDKPDTASYADSGVAPAARDHVQTLQSPSTSPEEKPGSPQSIRKQKPVAFYLAFVALNLMAFIAAWDSTSIAVALPTIVEDVGGTTFESFWANISFILAVAVTQPIYVSTSDVLGRKSPLYLCMVLFAIGAIVFATAQTIGVVIVGRIFQGLGAGGLDVLEAILLADITTLKERPIYLGIASMSIAIGCIAGPVVGAAFAQDVTWRWIGWLNLPIIIVALVLAVLFLRIRSIDMPFSARVRRLDGIGMLLFTIGATAVSLPLSWADSVYDWSSWRTILPLVIGVVVLIGFGFWERIPAAPVIPHRLFSNRSSNASFLGALLHGMILYAMLNYLPLYFQAVWLETPIGSAVSLLAVSCTVVGFSVFAPVTIEITRRYRLLLWIGWAFMIVFLALWVNVGAHTPRAVAYAYQALLGVGAGIVFTGTQFPVQAAVEHVDDMGVAVGLVVCFRLFGGMLGLSLSSTVFTSEFGKSIQSVGALPSQISFLEDPKNAVGFIPHLRTLDLPPELVDALTKAYTVPFRTIWIVMVCVCGAGLISSLFIKELSLERDDIGRQAFETEKESGKEPSP